MEDIKISEKNGNLLTVEIDGVAVSFFKNRCDKVVEVSRKSYDGSTYLDAPRYAQLLKLVHKEFGLTYQPVSYTLKAIRNRRIKKRKDLLKKGAQSKLPL